MLNIIKYRFWFVLSAVLLVGLCVTSLVMFGLKPGIDFTGGVAWQLSFKDKVPTREQLIAGFPDALVIAQPNGEFLIRMKEISDAQRQASLKVWKTNFGAVEEVQFQDIGPAVGEDLKKKAMWAFGLVLIAISSFVAFAFRKVSKPVSSWKYGIITLVTLFHDALIPAGLFAVLGKFLGLEVDTNFVVAVLVVMGFSVHDTIVVFDRIRENLKVARGAQAEFNTLVNNSINQTLARSINTSLTLVITLVALYFFGPVTLQYFILMILVGTIMGTYSSIFVASPLLTYWRGKA